jgi:RNA polymerase sigma factor (sigma-70 family)
MQSNDDKPRSVHQEISLHARQLERHLRRALQAGGMPSASVDDFCQEVFLKAMEGERRFRGDCTTLTWLCGIARNLARNYRRNKRMALLRSALASGIDIQECPESSGLAPDAQLHYSDLTTLVESACQRYMGRELQLIRLVWGEGQHVRDAARSLDIPGWRAYGVLNQAKALVGEGLQRREREARCRTMP